MRLLDFAWITVTAAALAGCDGGNGATASGGSAGSNATAGSAGASGSNATAGSSGSDSTASMSGGSAGMGGSSSGGSAGTAGGGAGLPDGPSSSRLTIRPVGTVDGATIGYAEYLPVGYGDGKKRPLLIFHHGIGESGNGSEGELQRLFNTGLPTLIKNDKWPSDRPFVVLMTQHNAPPFQSCHSVEEVDSMLKFAMGHYDVDPKRVYITGLSCGAIGSWAYLGEKTDELVAAAVLIAGDGKGAFNKAGCALGKVPIWGFHGDKDGTVNVSGTVEPITKLQMCMNPAAVDAKMTIYPDVDHNSWDMTYDGSAGHDIYAWMLGHSK